MAENNILNIVSVFYEREHAVTFIKSNKKQIDENDIRLIIADNGGNAGIIKDDCPEYIASASNKGFGAGINSAARAADAKYLLILNDDIILPAGFIKSLIKKIEFYEMKGYSLVGFRIVSKKSFSYGLHRILYGPSVILYHFSFLPALMAIFDRGNGYCGAFETMHFHKASKLVKGVNGSAFLIRSDMFKMLGGFDEKYFMTYEETDLFRRVLMRGRSIFYDEQLTLFHLHTTTADKKSLKYSFTSMKYFMHKHFTKFENVFVTAWIFVYLILKTIVTMGKSYDEFNYFINAK